MIPFAEKRQSYLGALEGYAAKEYVPADLKMSYEQFLLHTDDMDLGETLLVINTVETLRKKHTEFGMTVSNFLLKSVAMDKPALMHNLIALKRAFNIQDQNYEFWRSMPNRKDEIADLSAAADEADAIGYGKLAERRAEGEVILDDVDIRDFEPVAGYIPPQPLPEKPSESAGPSFFAIMPTDAQISEFMTNFNVETRRYTYTIVTPSQDGSEYDALRDRGLTLPHFRLTDDDRGMKEIFEQAQVIGKRPWLNDKSLSEEACAAFGLSHSHGRGVEEYYMLKYSSPAVKEIDAANDHITLIFAKEKPASPGDTHVAIRMPLSKVVEKMKKQNEESRLHLETFHRNPGMDWQGINMKLADAVYVAQKRSSAVLMKTINDSRPQP